MGRVCNGPSLLWAEMSSYRYVLCADVLSSEFIICDFYLLTFELHVLSFPFFVQCYMF